MRTCVGRLQMIVPDQQIIHVRYLEREMVKARLRSPNAEQCVMIYEDLAPVDPVERRDDIVPLLNVDLVTPQEAKRRSIPGLST